jgi:adenylate cyclase
VATGDEHLRPREKLIEHLRSLGVGDDEISRATREQRLALLPAELALTGGAARLRLPEVAREADVDIAVLRSAVAALGLPVPPDDAVVASDDDVEAARLIRTILQAGLDTEALLEAVRVSGQASAVTARSIVASAGRSVLAGAGSELEAALKLESLARELVPVVERLNAFQLRRHLLEAVRAQVLTAEQVEAGDVHTRTVAVGFADLSGFTRLGSRTDAWETGRVAARLGELAAGVAKRPVELVKLVGDGAMLVSPEPHALVDALLTLNDEVDGEAEDFPQLHAGAAHGPAVPRAGDWFGHTVSLASRLSNIARAGSLVVDEALRGVLGDERYRFSRLPVRHVRGVPERMALYRLRRADAGGGSD